MCRLVLVTSYFVRGIVGGRGWVVVRVGSGFFFFLRGSVLVGDGWVFGGGGFEVGVCCDCVSFLLGDF